MVECAPLANDGDGVVASGNEGFSIAGRNEAQTADAIRFGSDGIPNMERFENLDAFRRNAASACFVTGELLLVHKDDVANAQLAQLNGGGATGGTRSNDEDIR
jgi:hypothetical protein